MNSTRPYLLRAIYQWISDNGFTPYILVDTTDPHVVVPKNYVKDHSIVLNVAPEAVSQLELGNDFVTFSARFNGVPQNITVPIASVQAIYARENGKGLVLPDDDDSEIENVSREPNYVVKEKTPHLKVVK